MNSKEKALIIRVLLNNLSLEIDKHTITIQQYVTRLATQGMSNEAIKELLKTDAKVGGRIFGELKRSLQKHVIYTANSSNTDAKVIEFGDDKQLFQWVAVVDKNTCPDCAPRHNQVMTLAEWEELGVPGAGATVCQEYCRCSLIPVGILSEEDKRELELPISRNELKDFLANRKEGMTKFMDEVNNL